jgi:hypothetical protein
MTVSELVARGVESHLGGSYAQALNYFVMALLVTNGVPAERFDALAPPKPAGKP